MNKKRFKFWRTRRIFLTLKPFHRTALISCVIATFELMRLFHLCQFIYVFSCRLEIYSRIPLILRQLWTIDWSHILFVCVVPTSFSSSLFGREVRGWLGTNTALVVKIVEGRLLLFLTLFKLMFWNSVLALFILFNFRISVLFFLNEDVNQRFTSRNVTAPYNIQTLACNDM